MSSWTWHCFVKLSVLLILHACQQICVGSDSVSSELATVTSIIPLRETEQFERSFYKENSVGYNDTVNSFDSGKTLKRGKRYLDIVKGTRMSWRFFVKNNILKVNTQFGYAYGFRTNYPFPNREDRYAFPFNKREAFHMLEDVMDGHGFDGRACILKTYCAALHYNKGNENGMLFKLMKMVFTLEHHEMSLLPYLKAENCKQLLYSHCPLDLEALSPYTDISS